MLLPKSKGKKKPEEERWIKIKEQTKGKTTLKGGAIKEYLENRAFFPIFIF